MTDTLALGSTRPRREAMALGSTYPYRSILAATDFSDGSAAALRQATRIARLSGATVRVAHVIDTGVAIELARALTKEQTEIRSALTRDAAQAWKSFALGIEGAGDLDLDVSINNRVVGIVARCRETTSDLLILGAGGDRSPSVGAGTVATGCVRSAPCDVLLVRANFVEPFTTVVAAVDFSETSIRGLQRAASLAVLDGAELHVLHAFRPPWEQLHYKAPTLLTAAHLQKQYRDGLERRLASLTADATTQHPGLRARSELFGGGGHRSAIAAYAASVRADLVVLGTRGEHSLRDLLLGSTAEKALAAAGCSVLAVKPAAH
jgi:nucleotide-binding universal stress UspA family protein